jgi:predicted O-methyltransferase YrrM
VNKIRNFIFKTKILRYVTPLIKIITIVKFNFGNIKKSLVWLLATSEFTNYLYNITPLNKNQMIGAISSITNLSIVEVESYFDEIENNADFKNSLKTKADILSRRKELPITIPLGRRIVWYVLVRIYKPKVIVETGTDKGLGSLVIQLAIEKNQIGTLYTLDIDEYSGSLFDKEDLKKIKFLVGDSVQNMQKINEIDFFIHDSDHSEDHEKKEIQAAASKLTNNAIVISDNSHVTDVLFQWSKETNRNFIFIKEFPKDHWYPGGGVGISFKSGVGGI